MRSLSVWIGALVAALCGAAIGLIFTVAHRATVPVLGIAFPYGIVLGVIAVTALVAAMRLLWDVRIPAIGAAVGVVVGIAVLSSQGAGGGVVVASDAYGWTWLALPTVAVIVAVLWPRMRGRGGASEDVDTMDAPAEPTAEEPS